MDSENKIRDWQELTQLTQGHPLIVERVRLADKEIAIEGGLQADPEQQRADVGAA